MKKPKNEVERRFMTSTIAHHHLSYIDLLFNEGPGLNV